jgi:hypothetical protein
MMYEPAELSEGLIAVPPLTVEQVTVPVTVTPDGAV